MHAVARLHYAGLINNIQVSWVKMGVEGSRRLLRAGVNDVGGTLMDENISRAAGAVHGQEMDVDSLVDLVSPLGRPLVQRSTLYGVVETPVSAGES
jgi:FO synthase